MRVGDEGVPFRRCVGNADQFAKRPPLFVVANRDIDRLARGRECAVRCDCRVVVALGRGVNAETECTLPLEH